MATDNEILAIVDAAFGGVVRPEHFTDYTHCEECAEHEELLQSRDRTTLQISDVDNPGWDPICFCSPEGLAYYLPSLVRFALVERQSQRDWYGSQLLFHLYSGAKYNDFFNFCTSRQRQAVALVLAHFIETRTALVGIEADDLLRAHEIWSTG